MVGGPRESSVGQVEPHLYLPVVICRVVAEGRVVPPLVQISVGLPVSGVQLLVPVLDHPVELEVLGNYSRVLQVFLLSEGRGWL